MRIAVPDLVSNSYFPAVAAVELGHFKAEGVDAELQMISPIPRAMAALRDGEIDFVAGPAHATLAAFPDWQGAKVVAALAKQTFWLLVLRADLDVEPGDVQAVKGLRIGAAPGPEQAFRHLLTEAGIDLVRDGVELGRVPGAEGHDVNFGVHAAGVLERGEIDGFWANLVLHEVPSDTEDWRSNHVHRGAVALSPDLYRDVRIHNGRLSGGVNSNHEIVLNRTKYWDYGPEVGAEPTWMAWREL